MPSLPATSTEANREHLENWLLNYYCSSAFNFYQQLPLMQGPLMGLMIDPNPIQTAHHTPIPVPLHRSEKVKTGLDKDAVALGVF